MRVNKFSGDIPVNFNRKIKKEDKKSATNPIQTNQTASPVSSGLYAVYTKISFKGKPYDGTNFRADLEKRAEISKTSIKLYPKLKFAQENHKTIWKWDTETPEQELELYKTKHSEYVKSSDGAKIYKIKYVDNKDRITQQVMASKLYQSVGIRTPEYIAFEKNGKTGYLVEVFEEKLEPAQTNKKALYKSFVADVWLGNRNGLSKDNTKIDKDGNPVKMSVSGSLGYRASGKPKDKQFGYDIDEIKTMRDPSVNPDAAKELADMTDDELYEAINAFTDKYNYETEKSITGDYWPQETVAHDIHNVITNRHSYLKAFIQNNKQEKLLRSRGLLEKDTPSLTNLKSFDPSFSIDVNSALEITDEQWQKLKERGLFTTKPGLKKFGMYDYKFLAQMTDEEHTAALSRGLYAPCKNDELLYGNIDGWEISELCKLTDKQWEAVKKRNLLELKINHNIQSFKTCEFINQIVNLNDYDWNLVEYSKILDTNVKAQQVLEMLAFSKSETAKTLEPDFIDRIKVLASIEEDKKHNINKKFTAEYILPLAKISNTQWQLLMEITNNLTDTKKGPLDLLELVNLDDTTIDTLRKRSLLTTSDSSYGLKELALLSDEDWENIKKRQIHTLNPRAYHYKDWAYLATLTDEQYKLAQEKKLFENRSATKYERHYDGQEINMLVSSLDEKGWENFEKRGLFKDFYVFHGMGWSAPSAAAAIKLAQYSDSEFERFKEIQSKPSYIYPSTVFDLMNLNDIEYKRLIDRDLFQYQNTHESWDNWTQDAPVMTALAQLDDEEYEAFKAMKNNCKTIAAKTLIIKANKLGLDKKQNINELNFKEKKEYLKLLLNKNYTFLSKEFQDNYNCTGIIPKNPYEMAVIVQKLVKSVGIDTRPLEQAEKRAFFNALDKIAAHDSEFKNLQLKNPNFKLKVKYSRNQFISDITNIVKNLDENEQRKVWDYFGCEISQSTTGNKMSGYPVLANNGAKLKEIENPQTKLVIEQIKPYINKFIVENAVLPDEEFVSQDMAATFNDLLKGLPELYSIIGKEQHKTHDYTVDVHTLAVLQECVKNPYFNSLSNTEKRALILAALLHDITKEEKSIDKAHPQNSAYDAYYILKKFDMDNAERLKIYQLIKNHDLLEHCNKAQTEDEQDRLVKQYAYELRADNLAELAIMLTKADLKGVKRDGSFFTKYQDALNSVSKKLKTEVKEIKKTAIPLPQTKIPKASQITTDGVNVVNKITTDKDGNEIKNKVIYLSKGLDLSKYGFAKGVTAENFNVIVHGFDNETQQSTLEALDLPDQNALLSASYIFYEKGNYHTFRPQGFIKEIPADNIGAAYYRDFGSGCKKTEESLLNDYIFGENYMYRKYFSELMKKELNLSDEAYIELFHKIKDKPIEQIEQETPYAAYAIKNIFSKMETYKRKFQRDYNEVLVGKGQTTGVFFVGKDEEGKRYESENIPEYLRKYAQDNDLPIIYFGE